MTWKDAAVAEVRREPSSTIPSRQEPVPPDAFHAARRAPPHDGGLLRGTITFGNARPGEAAGGDTNRSTAVSGFTRQETPPPAGEDAPMTLNAQRVLLLILGEAQKKKKKKLRSHRHGHAPLRRAVPKFAQINVENR
ncbi:hypothetical protein HPB50_002731 [Hyalomma asiaticum]|uniref:Uncharacterized protein n=1 Tax=Hyalomma asiaticum TaxID=266040 RepID=A0ACB7THN4_HYAAI|nr:hypothetical protein HPB50_002731 [Hyalomma asiaticum]